MADPIFITKHSGEQQAFSTDKLMHSLRNAGAKESTIKRIVKDIEDFLYPGISTKQIYKRAYTLLQKEESQSFRYHLKQAIYELGPTGYPFEFLVGEIYRRQGWEVEVGQVLQGASVTHEMDVIATKDRKQHLIECKYHKDQGKQVSIQVPLYVRSRVNDIIEYRRAQANPADLHYIAGVATNTRFSEQATAYAEHSKIKLLSWDYPQGQGLKDLIERYYIYPVTILKDLSLRDKRYLLEKEIVLCYQLDAQKEVLDTMAMNARKKRAVLQELAQIAELTPFF